jgi:hypothetical protein
MSTRTQGCQMVYFQTKNPSLGKFWWVSFIPRLRICINFDKKNVCTGPHFGRVFHKLNLVALVLGDEEETKIFKKFFQSQTNKIVGEKMDQNFDGNCARIETVANQRDFLSKLVDNRVARWFVFKPKIPNLGKF